MPARLVGGARGPVTSHNCLDKGKKRAGEDLQVEGSSKRPLAMAADNAILGYQLPKRKMGRVRGVSNYNQTDKKKLFSLVRQFLPIGEAAWRKLAVEYDSWAVSVGRPTRGWQSLKMKFRQV